MTEALTERLTGIRDGGRKLFVPYVTGGLDGVDAQLLRGLQEAGADAVEVGLPFSDPVMDGPVIQEASRRALEGGTDPDRVLSLVSGAALDVPIIIMTYVNPVLAYGVERLAADVATRATAPASPGQRAEDSVRNSLPIARALAAPAREAIGT